MAHKKKNFVLIMNGLTKEDLGKDPFVVPYYIKQIYGVNVTIVYPQNHLNNDLPAEYRGISLYPIKHSKESGLSVYFLKVAGYLFKNARKIDILMTFHIFMRSGRIALLYKLLNRKGKSYVKLDIPLYVIDRVSGFMNDSSIKSRIKQKLYTAFFKRVDLFSCEGSDAYNRLTTDYPLSEYMKHKLILLENGCDPDFIKETGVEPKDFGEKENIFLTVGRLGTFEKHTELFLEALAKVRLNDWKVYMVGPVKEEFEPYVKDFYEKNPLLKDKVVFTGAVYDKKKLFDFYSRSKVFVLTSRTESSGIVLYEAKLYKNYIISTPVGAAHDVITGDNGYIIGHDPDSLADAMNRIASGEVNIDVYGDMDMSDIYIDNQIKKLKPLFE